QLNGEEPNPKAAECEDGAEIPDRRNGAGRMHFRAEVRARHPEKIDAAHEDHPDSDLREQPAITLHVARKKNEEGQKEMANQNDDGDAAPITVKARTVEGDLFGKIAGPDDEQL